VDASAGQCTKKIVNKKLDAKSSFLLHLTMAKNLVRLRCLSKMSDCFKRKFGEESPNTISPERADKKIAANGRPQ
jgi:hypothetical protein